MFTLLQQIAQFIKLFFRRQLPLKFPLGGKEILFSAWASTALFFLRFTKFIHAQSALPRDGQVPRVQAVLERPESLQKEFFAPGLIFYGASRSKTYAFTKR